MRLHSGGMMDKGKSLQSQKLLFLGFKFLFGDNAVVEQRLIISDFFRSVAVVFRLGRTVSAFRIGIGRALLFHRAESVEFVLHKDQGNDTDKEGKNQSDQGDFFIVLLFLSPFVEDLARAIDPVYVIEGHEHAEQQFGGGISLFLIGCVIQEFRGAIDPNQFPNAERKEEQKRVLYEVVIALLFLLRPVGDFFVFGAGGLKRLPRANHERNVQQGK